MRLSAFPIVCLLALAVVTDRAHAQTAAEWSARGRALLDSGKNDAAVKAFEKAVKLDSLSSANHMSLAEALGQVARKSNVFKQGLMAGRIKREMERARALDPKSIDPHEGLLQFYMEAPGFMGGSMDKARAEAVEISRLNRMRGHYALADIARHDKDSAAMEREYRGAYTDAPDSVVAYSTLAFYYYNTKRHAEAFATLDKVLARRPDEPMALFYIGRLAAVSGEQLDRGEAYLRKYLTLPPNAEDKTRAAPASAHFRLGEVLVKKNNKLEARKEFETALQLNPRLEVARTALKSLGS
jgi:tetratricopeptide (TPR) repeat protein